MLWDNDHTGDIVQSSIWLGQYQIDNVELQKKMLLEASLMHVTELKQMLELLNSRLGFSRVAVMQVSKVKEDTSRICLALHELLRRG